MNEENERMNETITRNKERIRATNTSIVKRSAILKAVDTNPAVFWIMTPRSLMER
jgi:hypothetical protein